MPISFIMGYGSLPSIVYALSPLLGLVFLVPCIIFGLYIEQKAGYYQCDKCKHKFVPTYAQVAFAIHYGRTRHMKCPKCKKRSYCKKVVE